MSLLLPVAVMLKYAASPVKIQAGIVIRSVFRLLLIRLSFSAGRYSSIYSDAGYIELFVKPGFSG